MSQPEKRAVPGSGTFTRRTGDLRIAADVLALLELSAAWNSCEPSGILEMLLEALEALLPVDVSYAVATTGNGAPIEVARVAGEPAQDQLDALREVFADRFGHIGAYTGTVTSRELGNIHVVASPFSSRRARGAIVVGSRLVDFPNEAEMPIVGATAKLVASGLTTASALHEREVANRAKKEFVTTVVHELRHPLEPIAMALELLKTRSGIATSNEVAVIERQLEHLRRLIEDLSSLSRASRGELDVKKEVIELADAVTIGIEAARPLVGQRRHDLRVNVPVHGMRVLADRTRIAEVVANLLTNAAKYTEPGGHIELSARREGSLVVLRVCDDGVGIAADLLPSVFERFVRGQPRTGGMVHAPAGLGIGLAVVKHLVSLHGGNVAASSGGIGKGSVFTVRLPALDAGRNHRNSRNSTSD